MQLFYNPDILEHTKEILFTKDESRHIIKVLRKKENDLLHITNGKGLLFTAQIIIPSDKKCVAKVIKTETKEKGWSYYLHIAIAPTKNMDRIEWFIEKATEIGIDEITPIICHNSERKVVKIERLEKIMLAAMKQSLKFTAPKLNTPIKFNDFIQTKRDGFQCIAHCYEGEKKSLKTLDDSLSEITIIIGPEGDFSLNEVAMALENNCTPITLGNSRLRTETAGLVATQMVSFIKA